MAALNQIIAIEKGVKSRTYSRLTEANKVIQKKDGFDGMSRKYQPKDAEGEPLPPERKVVQHTVDAVLQEVQAAVSELMDLTARKDLANTKASAPIIVDGAPLLSVNLPATYLLFLEKQLTDLRTLFGNLPVLDISEEWQTDINSGLFRTDPVTTNRTKKTPRVIVKYEATPQHPAQTELVAEDLIVGFWEQTRHSGAIPAPRKELLLKRVEKLLDAVKQAREAANAYEENESSPVIGEAVFNYLLAGKV